jgi:transcription initiation factor TFIID TATA-box-binding protein
VRVRIENVVASAPVGSSLDLQSIALALDGAEYNPSQFPGLVYRQKDPKTAVLLFQSGKAVCTGAKSWRQVDETLQRVSALVRKTGQKMHVRPKFQVQNIVATADLGGEVNLASVAVSFGLERVEYEPEQFPGLVCRIADPHVVVLLFGSGKLVCTGARRPRDLQRAVEQIAKDLSDAELLVRTRAPAAPAPGRPSPDPRPRASVPKGLGLEPESEPRPHVPPVVA